MNAKEEFIEHTVANEVICATIEYNDETISLMVNYKPFDLVRFLGLIDFEYDNGYGGQELYGTIWYKNGDWSERGEYDGSEWWELKSCPEIPIELQIKSV